MKSSGNNRIVVDWDGTCVNEVWPGQGDWLPGAVDTLKSFLAEGWDVVIFSTRLSKKNVDEVTDFDGHEDTVLALRRKLDDAGLQEVDIWLKDWKPGAVYYIDDKAIRFEGKWYDVVKQIERNGK